jgi:pimeloyl-ACP methyl ester carboxylesterase
MTKVLAGGIVAAVVLWLSAIVWRRVIQRRVMRRLRLTGPTGIEELSAWEIGGVRQWVQLRGEDIANPLLVYLHGGPGLPMMPFAHDVQRPWEKNFTVVQWDQRNSGLTLRTNGVQSTGLTLARHVEDGLELVSQLTERFPNRPVVLLGHSWGSAIAVEMLVRAPGLFAAYVGVGQVSDFLRAERYSYETLVEEASRRGDERLSKRLATISDYPADPATRALSSQSLRTVRNAAMKFGFGHHRNPRAMLWLFGLALQSPHYSWRDVLALAAPRAQAESVRLALREFPRFFDTVAGATLTCPVVMVGGEFDLFTPTPMARELFETLRAPAKHFIEVPDLAHFGPLEDPDAFTAILRDRVLPLVSQPDPLAASPSTQDPDSEG